MKVLKDNGISKVSQNGLFIYKKQPKFLTDNEIYCLKTMYHTGYVPYAEQVAIDTIRLEYIGETPVTSFDVVTYHFARILKVLNDAGIRHGDLTRPNVLIRGNRPYVIDFSESRLACDPRIDKRPEGDEYWLKRTFEELNV